jgi:cobalt-zinc-cadmium efflux system outer membrane protein
MRAFVRFLSLASVAAATALAAGDAPLTLEQVLADVRAHNPALQAAGATAAAEHERATQASAWQDPVGGLEIMRSGTRSLTRYSEAEFQLSQKIPLSGNRERRQALANAEAHVATTAIRSRELALAGSAREAFFSLLRDREQLALLRDSDHLLDLAVNLTRSRLATGNADTAALLAAESERARLRERIITLDREAADATALLNTLRDLPPQSPVGELAAPVAPPAPFASLAEAQAHAFAHRPELAEADARITAADRARDLADRAWRPDPEVMLRARHENGGSALIHEYDTGIAVSLPWFNDSKYRSAQREATHRREAATLDAAAVRANTAAEVRDMWQRLDTARRTSELYRDRLLPLARAASDNARAGLVTGKTSLADLIAAQRALVEAQTVLAANLSDSHRYSAMLVTLTGAADQP